MSGVEFEENIYYEQSENPDIFHVNMVINPAAERCNLNGDYEFHINTENFALVDRRQNKRLYTWPFRYVRRYGKSSTNFQFEAGRKTQSGEGLFSLLTKEGEGEKIFDLVQTRFTQMKQRDKEYKAEQLSLTSVNSVDGQNPSLPPRKYDKYENKDIPSPIRSPTASRTTGSMKSKPPAPAKPQRSSGATAAAPAPKLPTAPKPQNNGTPKPGPTAKPNTPKTTAELNSLIAKNKSKLTQPEAAVDNTYDMMGQADNPSAAYGAAYGDVYGESAASRRLYTDDSNMYDEVNQS